MGRILRRKIDEFFQSGAAVEDSLRKGGLRLDGSPTSKASNRRVTPEIDDLNVAIPKMTVLDEQL